MRYLKLIVCILITTPLLNLTAQEPITFEDIMKFKDIDAQNITKNGAWVTYKLDVQRGNPEFVIQSTESDEKYSIERGVRSQNSLDTKWFVVWKDIDVLKKLNSEKNKDEKPDLELINTENEYRKEIEDISNYKLADNGKWLFYTKAYDKKEEKKGEQLILRHLESETEIPVENVIEFETDSLGSKIFYSTMSSDNYNGLYYRNLNDEYAPENHIEKDSSVKYTNLSWDETSGKIAYLKGNIIKKEKTKDNALKIFNLNSKDIITVADTSSKGGWYIPEKNDLKFTDDDNRLWFGYKPLDEWYEEDKDTVDFTEENLYDTSKILKQTEMYLWHTDDPEIMPHQINQWSQRKDRIYYSIYDFNSKNIQVIATKELQNVQFTENPNYATAYDMEPYKKEITWNGWFFDLHSINLKTGESEIVEYRLEESANISPNGRYIVYYKLKQWYVYDNQTGEKIHLNKEHEVPFYDVMNDRPMNPSSYRIEGWIGEDDKVLIYDEFDIWQFDLSTGEYKNLTDGVGRENKKRIRIVNLDRDRKWFELDEKVIVQLWGKYSKKQELGILDLSTGNIDIKYSGDYVYSINEKSEFDNKIIYSRQGFDTYPDLWLSDTLLTNNKQLTTLQKQVDKFKWGKSHLMEYVTDYGDTLQGTYALPDDYEEGKEYPVFVYFYERFSNRKNMFNMPKINHRPPFSLYLGSDYIMFFPDIKYYDGNPGESSLKALIAGCDSLVSMGVADPDRIVLHGHSWSGYQSAWLVTQTDYFKACVSGAPVSNMTSAYSGIRLGSGLARQFQYESTQSRIGGNLIDSLDSYIRNSPVFYADQMNTPLLMMFGDKDEAVPWQQGIELYLALRRFDKECIFLQYEDEPHHLKKFHNQLDYSIRMKEFMDHYVFETEMPKWMKEGYEYWGTYNIGR